MSGADDLAVLLAGRLDGAEITDLTRLSGGASRETWRFAADGVPRIVQRQRAGDERDMMIEARVVAAAGAAGVPAPELIATDEGDDGSAFMVLEAIDGETIARKLQRDDEFAHARTVLTGQLGNALAAVHSMPPVDGLEPVDPIAFYTEVLDNLVAAGTGSPQPMLELVRRWLIDHRPPPVEPVVVHGDFRLGNLIVGDDGLRAVIDWELAHLGDPMEDLGWLCVKAWRFGQQPPVAGPRGVRRAVRGVRGCRRRRGRCRRRALVGGARHLEVGDHVHPAGERAPQRRGAQPRAGSDRTSRVRERTRSVPRTGGALVSLHGAPSSAELLEAVREWLERDVMSSTEGRLRFHARVAANVLATVERELGARSRAGCRSP